MSAPTPEQRAQSDHIVATAAVGDRLILRGPYPVSDREVTVYGRTNTSLLVCGEDSTWDRVWINDNELWLDWPDDADEPPQVNEPLRRASDKARQVVRAEVTLDPSDPFEAVLVDIVATNRKKRHDYTSAGSSPWENFDRTEDQTGHGVGSAVETLIATKQARLRALTSRGDPQNESIEDTLLDRAVYAIIACARRRYPDGKVT